MSKLMVKLTQPVATLSHSFQINDKEWDKWTETKICTMNTPMSELYDWVKARTGFSGPHCAEIKVTFAEMSNE